MSIRSLGLVLAAVGVSGCIVVASDGTPVYSTCFETTECESSADVCYDTVIDWGGVEARNGTCTRYCSADADCPYGSTGELGGCYDVSGEFVCYERCNTNRDCPTGGWTCANVEGVAGDTICVPM